MTPEDPLTIIAIDRLDSTTVLANFSDHTFAEYTVEQLLSLGNERTKVDEVDQNDI